MSARISFIPPVRFILACTLFALGTSILAPSAQALSEDAKIDPTLTIQAWLEEIDAGHYTQSWNEAAPSLQKALSAPDWMQKVKAMREPLGKLTSRAFNIADEKLDATGPGGALHGDFIVAQFDASFAKVKYAVETVTFQRTADGAWKAAGYVIKPG